MRLTLRTLLAYLDDALEPAQAKLIGQKVAESEAAQELIGRIKQVTCRRRLTTPPLTGPGARFDPNTIAEYLDNVLPSDQVTELEETCLASDVHLAEVAACHQVLTLFLGEPVPVPPTARQRMYGLIRGREAIPHRKVPAPKLEEGAMQPARPTAKKRGRSWGCHCTAAAEIPFVGWLPAPQHVLYAAWRSPFGGCSFPARSRLFRPRLRFPKPPSTRWRPRRITGTKRRRLQLQNSSPSV